MMRSEGSGAACESTNWTRFFFRQAGSCTRSVEAFFFKPLVQDVARSSEGIASLRFRIVCEGSDIDAVLVMLIDDCTYSQIGGSEATLNCD